MTVLERREREFQQRESHILAAALALWDEMLDNDAEAREWPRARIQVADIRRLMKKKRAEQVK